MNRCEYGANRSLKKTKFEYNDWILINYSKIYSDLALIKEFFDLI